MKRQRGRNRKPGGGGANSANPNRSWDSQGPENIKVRGNAQTVYERYMQLARDASSAGDRVLAENYLQHAEHYFRVLRALQPQRPASEIAQRELAGQGFDIDFEDESGAQAAAFLAAQQAADRAAEEERRREQQRAEPRQERDRPERQDRDRPERGDRDRDGDDGEARAEGEGGRRETRRERWERRQQERQRRFAEERGATEGGAEDAPVSEAAPQPGPEDDRADDEAPAALPGFLTRAPEPTAAAEASAEEEAPAPRRRAPRRKAATPAD